MGLFRTGILGLNHTPLIDSGTLARTRTLCPGINITEVDSLGYSVTRKEAREIDERWRRAKENDDKALRAFRDSIISYDVDKREDSLPKAKKGKIRLKLKRKPGETNGKITYVFKKNRVLSKIDALVLHSTAGPEKPLEKYWDLSVHFVITPNGTIIQNHDEAVKAYGSSGFNSRSVSVEFVGHFKWGIDRRGKEKWWKGSKLRSVPTVQQIYSGRKLVSYLKRTLDIKYVLAHSQAANKNCPGPEIWFNVGEWAIKNGLSADGTNITKGVGKSIPSDWRKEKWDFKNRLLTPNF